MIPFQPLREAYKSEIEYLKAESKFDKRRMRAFIKSFDERVYNLQAKALKQSIVSFTLNNFLRDHKN